MKLPVISLGGLAAASAVLTLGLGTAAAAPNYDTLPVNPNSSTDSTAYVAVAPVMNPGGQQGVEQEFTHRDGSRAITTKILVLSSPQAATDAMNAWSDGLGGVVVNPTTASADVGTAATWVTGTSPNGSQSVGVLMFTRGNAAVDVQFDGPVNDPVPADLATQYGKDQVAALDRELGT
ncbi:hypothetical protein FK535_17605 [Mycolicibacterium sp. 018/SC-01/001]|uniref:hypothetical protein n=1 Tax=Mycolicibacterium sp. 018/SC-01/001 TaxID=2592069 RepID=UPI00117DEF2A|nr:hypothetical protein [Mycolicibacterium sp. 018/SC-01/001]TRW80890.1 hypothetical protein FK535_17605 [Mycolicibacterium sp. 018/SC-01/001]